MSYVAGPTNAFYTLRHRRWRRKRYAFIGAMLMAFVLFCIGFFLFLSRLDAMPSPSAEKVDAIVVLTGGKYRVSQSLELLRERQGQRLLISGVHPETSINNLISLEPGQSDMLRCCVDLGREATSTVGNAWETKRWVERGGYDSILLVTSNYHMPRSLMEISRALPKTRIQLYPVMHEGVDIEGWWRDAATAELLFKEYVKFLVSAMRTHLYPQVEGMEAAPIKPLKAGA